MKWLAVTLALVGVVKSNVFDSLLRRTEVKSDDVTIESEAPRPHDHPHHHQQHQQLPQPIYFPQSYGHQPIYYNGGYLYNPHDKYPVQHHQSNEELPKPVKQLDFTTTVVALPSLALPQLPQLALPNIPGLPGLPKRQTVTAFRTIYLETTRRVARHPICMTTRTPLSPCVTLPRPDWHDGERRSGHGKIEATPVAELPDVQETRLLGEVTESEAKEADYYDEDVAVMRAGRYLVPHPSGTAQTQETSESEQMVDSVRQQMFDNYDNFNSPIQPTHQLAVVEAKPPLAPLQSVVGMILPKVTVTATRTLWVTRVSPIHNPRVTATLVAENCLPVHASIPFCFNPEDDEFEKAIKSNEA